MEKNLRELAVDIADGKIFGTWNLPERDVSLIPSIFMPIVFMKEEDLEELKKVTHLYAYYTDAIKMCINGYPIFPKFCCLNAEECHIVMNYVEEIQKFKSAFLEKDNAKA